MREEMILPKSSHVHHRVVQDGCSTSRLFDALRTTELRSRLLPNRSTDRLQNARPRRTRESVPVSIRRYCHVHGSCLATRRAISR